MNHRFVALLGASSAVVLAIALLSWRIDMGEVPIAQASAAGEILSPLALAADERIEIDYSDEGCRSWHNWSFVFFGGPERRLAVIDAGGSYEGGFVGSDRPSPIGAISLSDLECRGLRDLLQLYRHPDQQSMSTTTVRIRTSYYRGSEKVGAEEFVDHGTVEHWLYQRDNDGLVPITAGVTPEMISLRQLMRRAAEANQSLEPTPTAGTSAAEQPLVPAAVVAHL